MGVKHTVHSDKADNTHYLHSYPEVLSRSVGSAVGDTCIGQPGASADERR